MSMEFDEFGEPLSKTEAERRRQLKKEEAEFNRRAQEETAEREAAIAHARENKGGKRYLPEAHRLLPQSLEAEQGVLSSAFLAPREVLALCDERGVTPEWFWAPKHATMFVEMREMSDSGVPLEMIGFTQRLRDKGLLDAVGGAAGVTETFCFLPTAANTAYYLDICHEKWFLREVIKTCTELAARAYEEQDQIEEIRGVAEAAIIRISEGLSGARTQLSIKEAVFRAIDKINAGKTEDAWGLSTGYPNLDAVARGLRAANMIAIGGETSSGKTSLALNLIHNLCIKRSVPSLVVSAEMTTDEITEILLQIGSGSNVDAALEGRLGDNEMAHLAQCAELLAKSPLTIRDDKEITILQVRSMARRLKPRIIVLDYAQLLAGGKTKYERSDLEIADISRNAKKMAGELSATVFLLTQLNDDGKVAGSRAIGKDADQIWIVEEKEEDDRQVKICKQRRGRKEKVYFKFIGSAQKFLPKALT